MLTTNSTSQILLGAEIAARSARLIQDFPSLAEEPGFAKRLVRAVSIVNHSGTIFEIFPGVFQVKSESNPQGSYTVDTTKKTCTCPDAGRHPERRCKHRLAVALYAGWFSQETKRPEIDLEKGYLGYITNPRVRRQRLTVKIIAIDAPANLVTIQVVSRTSAGQRFQPFSGPHGELTSCCTLTPNELKNSLGFVAAPAGELE
jgi:hypothetical protein